MFKKLQKKLTFLYTLTTGTILTVILIICFFYMKTAVEARYKAEFSDIFLTISNRFQTESFFTDSWLAQMESDNHLLIHIEENGKPLFFQGAFSPDTKRDVLLENARKKAADMGITLQAATFSSPLQTSAFTVKGNANDSYLCMYLVEAGISGGKSLLVMQDVSSFFQTTVVAGMLLSFHRNRRDYFTLSGELAYSGKNADSSKKKIKKTGRIYRRRIP